MSTKLFGKDIREYDDVDIDSLLTKLTTEELEELNNEVDPDNSLLPPSQRCRDQTNKEPTGPFNRQHLLKHLEESAKNEKDWEEKVPFEAGVKRGPVLSPKEDSPPVGPDEVELRLDVENGNRRSKGGDDDEEFEKALDGAEEADLLDLAGILGMHSMLSQSQYYKALKGLPQEADQNSFTGLIKTTPLKRLPDEPPNDTDVEKCIQRLKDNDTGLKEVNINNMKTVPKERIKQLIEAAAQSTNLEKLSLANTAISDPEARGFVELLEKNKSIKNLNVESNFLSGDMLAKMLRAMLKNQTVVEFHADNQRAAVLGNKVEMDMMQSIEENETLLRVGISFNSMIARHRVSDALEKNYEKIRLRRIGADV